jgi:hypothetical protein
LDLKVVLITAQAIFWWYSYSCCNYWNFNIHFLACCFSFSFLIFDFRLVFPSCLTSNSIVLCLTLWLWCLLASCSWSCGHRFFQWLCSKIGYKPQWHSTKSSCNFDDIGMDYFCFWRYSSTLHWFDHTFESFHFVLFCSISMILLICFEGSFIARYMKTIGPLWFKLHILMEDIGVACILTAFIIIQYNLVCVNESFEVLVFFFSQLCNEFLSVDKWLECIN